MPGAQREGWAGLGQVRPSPKELILVQLYNQAMSGFGTGGEGEGKEVARNRMEEVQNSKTSRDFPGGSLVKNLPCSAGDVGLVPSWGIQIL